MSTEFYEISRTAFYGSLRNLCFQTFLLKCIEIFFLRLKRRIRINLLWHASRVCSYALYSVQCILYSVQCIV